MLVLLGPPPPLLPGRDVDSVVVVAVLGVVVDDVDDEAEVDDANSEADDEDPAPTVNSIELKMHFNSQNVSWLIDRHRFKHSISVPLQEILSRNDFKNSSKHMSGHVLLLELLLLLLLLLLAGLILMAWFEIELRTAL